MSDQKIYVGNGKSKFDGEQVACSICLTKKYIKLIVQQKREADEYGKTHYVAVDTWKPEPKKEAVATPSKEDADLPF